MEKKFNGNINIIISNKLIQNADLLNKIICLVTNVYSEKDAELFRKEVSSNPHIIIVYMELNDSVIGLGCVCKSHISDDVYEFFWGMIHKKYRGNGWGKILNDRRLEWVIKHNTKSNIIVVTKSPWHLTRSGFEIIKQLKPDGEVLMYRKLI